MLKCAPFRFSPKVHHDVDHCSSGHGDGDISCTSILLGMSQPLLGIILLSNVRQVLFRTSLQPRRTVLPNDFP